MCNMYNKHNVNNNMYTCTLYIQMYNMDKYMSTCIYAGTQWRIKGEALGHGPSLAKKCSPEEKIRKHSLAPLCVCVSTSRQQKFGPFLKSYIRYCMYASRDAEYWNITNPSNSQNNNSLLTSQNTVTNRITLREDHNERVMQFCWIPIRVLDSANASALHNSADEDIKRGVDSQGDLWSPAMLVVRYKRGTTYIHTDIIMIIWICSKW